MFKKIESNQTKSIKCPVLLKCEHLSTIKNDWQ